MIAVKITFTDPGTQNLVLDKLKSAGIKAIQSSDGLIAKATSRAELTSILAPEGVTMTELTRQMLASASPDVVAFVNEA